jgi:hypothetical protein
MQVGLNFDLNSSLIMRVNGVMVWEFESCLNP